MQNIKYKIQYSIISLFIIKLFRWFFSFGIRFFKFLSSRRRSMGWKWGFVDSTIRSRFRVWVRGREFCPDKFRRKRRVRFYMRFYNFYLFYFIVYLILIIEYWNLRIFWSYDNFISVRSIVVLCLLYTSFVLILFIQNDFSFYILTPYFSCHIFMSHFHLSFFLLCILETFKWVVVNRLLIFIWNAWLVRGQIQVRTVQYSTV